MAEGYKVLLRTVSTTTDTGRLNMWVRSIRDNTTCGPTDTGSHIVVRVVYKLQTMRWDQF